MSELLAYYDLAVSPPTYDFVSFLLAAEMARLDGGHDTLAVHVLPGPRAGFRDDRLPPFAVSERRMMRDRIVAPMAWLLPSCGSCAVLNNRPVSVAPSIGYGAKCYGTATLIRAAQRSVYPLRAGMPSRQRDYVTITLRECSYWPSRNSDPAQWLQVADWLRGLGLRVVVVRDTSKASEPFGDYELAPLESGNLLARATLYVAAVLNLFVNNGPAWLCLFMGAPTLVVKMVAPEAPCTSAQFFARCGLPAESTWPNLRPRQCVSWVDDRAVDIIAAASRLLED